jgi:transcriptional regulator with XRE-family HTH domain
MERLKCMDVGTQIRIMRAARGISQQELASASGVPSYTLSLVETGKVVPTPEMESAIKRALRWPAEAEVAFAILEGEEATA